MGNYDKRVTFAFPDKGIILIKKGQECFVDWDGESGTATLIINDEERCELDVQTYKDAVPYAGIKE